MISSIHLLLQEGKYALKCCPSNQFHGHEDLAQYQGLIVLRATEYPELALARIYKKYPFLQAPTTFRNATELKQVMLFLCKYHLYKSDAEYKKIEGKGNKDITVGFTLEQKKEYYRRILPTCFTYTFPRIASISKRTIVDVTCPAHGFLYSMSIQALLSGNYDLCEQCEDNLDISKYLNIKGTPKPSTPQFIKKLYYKRQMPSSFSYIFKDEKITALTLVKYTCKHHSEYTGDTAIRYAGTLKCPACTKALALTKVATRPSLFSRLVLGNKDAIINQYKPIDEEDAFNLAKEKAFFNTLVKEAEEVFEEPADYLGEEYMFSLCVQALTAQSDLDHETKLANRFKNKELEDKELEDKVFSQCFDAIRGLTIQEQEEEDYDYARVFISTNNTYAISSYDLSSEYDRCSEPMLLDSKKCGLIYALLEHLASVQTFFSLDNIEEFLPDIDYQVQQLSEYYKENGEVTAINYDLPKHLTY